MTKQNFMENYWNQALSFTEYMQVAKDRAMNPDPSDEHVSYYELGLQRLERSIKTFKADDELLAEAKAKNFKGKILVITEPWCGDASSAVPAIALFFGNLNIPTKFFLRDSDHSLINQFLTDGSQSIPKVLILDEQGEVKNVWGPRPAYGMELLAKFKKDPEAYPRDEFYNDLQVYYAKNKGRDTLKEIIDLI